MKQLIVQVNPELHGKFKAVCSLKGSSMKAAIEGYIKRSLRHCGIEDVRLTGKSKQQNNNLRS